MGTLIRNLLIELLNKDDAVIGSWGVTNIEISDMQISFDVCAMKYKGRMSIEPHTEIDNSFSIRFLNGSINAFTTNLSSVVEDIDKLIEYSEDYNTILADWISKQV